MTIEIRKASPLDTTKLIDLAAALMDEVGDEPGSKGQVSRLFAEIERSDSDQVLVAKDDGKAVGMLLVHYRRAMGHGNWVAEVDDMYVTPEYRKHGVGALMLDEAEKLARKRDATALIVGVSTRNDNALGFYGHEGFVEVGRVLSKPLGD